MTTTRRQLLMILGALAGILGLTAIAAFWPRNGSAGSTSDPAAPARLAKTMPPDFVGRASCMECHENEDRLWSNSHHDLAMQPANERTVRGAFDGRSITHFGVTSTFLRRGDSHIVRTDGPDGALTDYPIAYVFGVEPLEQYLIELPGGRYQALSLCWDTRSEDDGGQRWFHLYPDEAIPAGDELHWTGPAFNWNYACAECHSTNLDRGYDEERREYATTWSEMDVSCEACHGPGSGHVDWAQRAKTRPSAANQDATKGLLVSLRDPHPGAWVIDPETGNAKRTAPKAPAEQIETCARCHARRVQMWPEYEYGRAVHDTHRVALLEERLYHADGQILDEVYVYGSFIQSRMYHEGVVCSDCHNAHSLELLLPGNALCARCHLPEKYDDESHHHHPAGSAGAQCVECHMPSRDYMVVDPRRDHSLRIPRPDLSVAIGTPNACNDCHDDESATWALDAVTSWYGTETAATPHYATALDLGRRGAPGAQPALTNVALDDAVPGIARATALALLAPPLTRAARSAIAQGLTDPDPIVRVAALESLDAIEPQRRLELAGPLLTDPVRLPRITAARVLADIPATRLTLKQRADFEAAFAETVAAERTNTDRPEAYVNIGQLHAQRGHFVEAVAACEQALELDPAWIPASANLADLYRIQGRDDLAEPVLRTALQRSPDSAALHHALGLLLVRQQRYAEALDNLAQAVVLGPTESRYAYVYGIALDSMGRGDEAVAILGGALESHPYDHDVLVALVTMLRDRGDLDRAIEHATTLTTLAPDSTQYRELLEQLTQARRR